MKLPFEVPPTWCLNEHESDVDWRDGAPKWGAYGTDDYLPIWHWFATKGRTINGHGCGPAWDIGGAGHGHMDGRGSSPSDGGTQ